MLYTDNSTSKDYFIDIYLNFKLISSLEKISYNEFKSRVQKYFVSTQVINDLCSYNSKEESKDNNKSQTKNKKLITISVVLGVLVCISIIVASYLKYMNNKSLNN